jgi:hypothetical protein
MIIGRRPSLCWNILPSAILRAASALENPMPTEGDAPKTPELGGSEGAAPVSAIERNLMKVAEELGALLGAAERKTTDMLSHKQSITEHLVKIRDTAARLLAQVEKGRDRSR